MTLLVHVNRLESPVRSVSIDTSGVGGRLLIERNATATIGSVSPDPSAVAGLGAISCHFDRNDLVAFCKAVLHMLESF